MQPDLGEVIIWVPVTVALLFVGGLPLRYLICVILIAIAFIPIAINFGLKPYQQQRITAFTHPDIDKQGSAWAINQSLDRDRLGWLVGQRDSRRQTRKSSSGFCPLLPCITTTFSPPSASNGDLLEECFLSAGSRCS